METKLFNGRFELALRILLILGRIRSASLGKLLAFDFIVTYASSFNLAKDNLHGDNAFNYSEIASRREMMKQGIRLLRMYNLLDINYSGQNGYEYRLTDLGRSVERQLNDLYVTEYKKILSDVFGKYSQFSSKKLMKLIDSNLMKELE
ncbi:hypothetical protein H3R26_05200 [Lactobacillus sp. W8092]|nr:hypothetical protein [Lactobacillus sp. W8092]